MAKNKNIQMDEDSYNYNDLRKEFEGKLEKLGDKIEKKISFSLFWSIMGAFAFAIILAGGYGFNLISKLQDKVQNMSDQILILQNEKSNAK